MLSSAVDAAKRSVTATSRETSVGSSESKSDLAGHRPERFRLVYRHVGTELVEIVVVGEQDEHAVYRDALARLTDNH